MRQARFRQFVTGQAAFLALCLLIPATALGQVLDQSQQRIADAVSAASMRGHLSFIASDLLEGRDTPSMGLDIAAEYIAAQFRRAGLEPVGDDGFFQTTTLPYRYRAASDFRGWIELGQERVPLDPAAISVLYTGGAVELADAPIVWIDGGDTEALGLIEDGSLAGHVVLTNLPDPRAIPVEQRAAIMSTLGEATRALRRGGAELIMSVATSLPQGSGLSDASPRSGNVFAQIPFVLLHDSTGWIDEVRRDGATLTFELAEMRTRPWEVKNVVGLLPGSDPELGETYVLVTAHYDHIGRGAPVDGDDINNGANDDGSGTVAVMELAAALAALPEAPRRSILFMCVFGEERGMLGSRFYVQNPIKPLDRTIANINLEHLGRTDDVEGESIARLMPTGYDFSTMTEWFVEAGERIGVAVDHHPRNSASFFSRSDNIAFAAAGIPAHTFCAAFIFPDYHAPGDTWEKIDYDNLALVTRAIGLGLWSLANSDGVPEWNREHRMTPRYIEAWDRLHGTGVTPGVTPN